MTLLARIFASLSLRDRILVYLFLLVALGAVLFWGWSTYLTFTTTVPKQGGQYVEGMVAQPRYINPILAQTSEADSVLAKLLYGSLFVSGANGTPEKSMAHDYTITEEGKVITVFLKPGIRFHDGEELIAEDVVFTVRAIQDPAYKSPLRNNWLGVEVNAPERYTIVFTLKKPYFGFLDNLTVGILPKHVWESIPADRFTLADYNLLQPVGSGPYRFLDIDKDADGNILSYHLEVFEEYFAGRAYLDRLTFRFYSSEGELLDAFNHQQVMGMYSIGTQQVRDLSEKRGPVVRELALPRLFSVFLNTNKSVALAYDEVRTALSLGTDRQKLIDQVFQGKALSATGPLLPFMFGFTESGQLDVDRDAANRLLDEKGWKRGDDGIRSKDGTPLRFALFTPDWPELVVTADLLREEWRSLGADVEVKVLSQADLYQNVIRTREYEALLFGQASMLDPDPYSFWHSSQKVDPGLNLAFFEEKRADEILSSARESLDNGKRSELYREFQAILRREQPAVFLFSPAYLAVTSDKVRGYELRSINTPADRFCDITKWYIKTKRVLK